MLVGYIDQFINNADKPLSMKVFDNSHLGTATRIDDDGHLNFNDQSFHEFPPHSAWSGYQHCTQQAPVK